MADSKIVTLKHLLLGLGLHNISDLRMPIKVLSHLGHCIDYNLVCEIETAETDISLQWFRGGQVRIIWWSHVCHSTCFKPTRFPVEISSI